MKTILLLTASSLLGANSFGQNGIIWTSVSNENELELIQSEDKVSSNNSSIQSLIDNFNVQSFSKALPSSKKIDLQKVYEITCDCNEHELLQEVSRMPQLFVAPEIGPHYSTLSLPNDYSMEFATDYALDLINAQDAWDVTTGDNSVIIAVSDQNFYVEHEDLIGKVHHYDTTNTANKNHGTAVAISAAGNTNNGMGKSSIGYNSELALYRMQYNDILVATYAGSRVINMSWSSGCVPSSYVQGVIDEAYENGSIIVAAAGNGGTCNGPTNLVYPAACDHVISVTSIGPNDNHERIPGDPSTTHQHNATVDISAPGYDVALSGAPGWYLTSNGSSFASPLVSGTVALMLAIDPCLTFEDIETILTASAVKIDALNPSYAGLLGAGRLDAGAALELASTYHSCDPPVEDQDVVGENLQSVLENAEPIVEDAEPALENTTPTLEGGLPTDDDDDTVSDEDYNDHHKAPTMESTAGLEENEVVPAELSIYPNPSNVGGNVTLKSNQFIESYDLIQLNGGAVSRTQVEATEIIIRNLAPGVYMLKINMSSGETRSERVIVV